MTWRRLDDLFADLETQAEGLYLSARDAEFAERSAGEYAAVALDARLHASVGEPVTLTVAGVGRLEGRLLRVGLDWCLIDCGQDWVIRLAAVQQVRGTSGRAVSEAARSVLARLGLASVLREMAEGAVPVSLWHRDGDRLQALPVRVGADFVEVVPAVDSGDYQKLEEGRSTVLVPFAALAAVMT